MGLFHVKKLVKKTLAVLTGFFPMEAPMKVR